MSMWDYPLPDWVHHVPPGLCDCDAFDWSAGPHRAHDPTLCMRWRGSARKKFEGIISDTDAHTLQAWFERESPIT